MKIDAELNVHDANEANYTNKIGGLYSVHSY